jgi:hypothetical protein
MSQLETTFDRPGRRRSGRRPGGRVTLAAMVAAWTLGLVGYGHAGGASETLLVSEGSGKLLLLDAAAPDPDDAVIAAVQLPKVLARWVATSDDGAFAFVSHAFQDGFDWVSVVDVAAVLNDVDPANDVVGVIPIPRSPSLGGQSVMDIVELHVSPDGLRLAVVLPSLDVFSNGIVYLVDLDPGSVTYLQIVDHQSLNANLLRHAFRPGTNELWIPNGLTIGTSGSNPGIHIRDGVDLDSIGSAANFGPSEAFAAPGGLRFDAAGEFAIVPMFTSGFVTLIRAATRGVVSQAKFGSSPNCGGTFGTSFPAAAALSADATAVLATLAGSRPFTFGCGVLTSAVNGAGFVDADPATGTLSNPSTLALAGGVRGEPRFSRASPSAGFILVGNGAHVLDVGTRSLVDTLRLGRCTGEGFVDIDSVLVPVGAPRRTDDYRDRDHDDLVDERCDPDPPAGCAGDAECADGLVCNGAEQCIDGECTAGAPPNCSGLDAACATGTCDEGAGGCVADPVGDGEPCDDGDACTTGEACNAGACEGGDLTPAACIDPFLCYRTRLTPLTPRFTPLDGLALEDQFESGPMDVRKQDSLCIPASVDGDGILDAETHRLAYRIAVPSGEDRHERLSGIVVEDRLGILEIATVRATDLLVPAGKGLGVPAVPPVPGTADSYKCYSVRTTENTALLPRGVELHVADQLEARQWRVLRPTRICNPVAVGGEPTVHPAAHLMCYAVRIAPGSPRHEPIAGLLYAADVFGELRLDTVTERVGELCLPATKAH